MACPVVVYPVAERKGLTAWILGCLEAVGSDLGAWVLGCLASGRMDPMGSVWECLEDGRMDRPSWAAVSLEADRTGPESEVAVEDRVGPSA